jgi:bifunctional non-homologous end joining protein LigD
MASPRGKPPKKAPKGAARRPSLDALAREYGDVQLATLVKEPPQGGWTYELKYDGYRLVGIKSGDDARLVSRSHKDWSFEFATVTDALRELRADTCVLDGEVCAVNAAGVPSFQLLQNRSPATHLMYFVFDCLMLEGIDLRSSPIEERRSKVAAVVTGPLLVASSAVAADPKTVLALACKEGFEGIVAKAAGSPYVPGRSRSWLKIKCNLRQEFAIVGWLPLLKTQPAVGALLLGLREPDGSFSFAGRVGTGFTERGRRELYDLLRRDESPKATATGAPPFGGIAHFVKPRHVAEVQFTEWTDGSHVRHPSFQGLRKDKRPDECVREVAR